MHPNFNRILLCCRRIASEVVCYQGLATEKFSAKLWSMAELISKQIARLESLIVGLQEVVNSLRGNDVAISPEIAERLRKFREELRCLYCEDPLGEGKVTRGCHAYCAQKVQRQINSQKLTLQQAVDKGWINPVDETPGPKPRGRDPLRGEAVIIKHDHKLPDKPALTHDQAMEKHGGGTTVRKPQKGRK